MKLLYINRFHLHHHISTFLIFSLQTWAVLRIDHLLWLQSLLSLFDFLLFLQVSISYFIYRITSHLGILLSSRLSSDKNPMSKLHPLRESSVFLVLYCLLIGFQIFSRYFNCLLSFLAENLRVWKVSLISWGILLKTFAYLWIATSLTEWIKDLT